MPGLLFITLISTLVSSCGGFRLTLSRHVLPFRQDESTALPHFIQELVRTKRHLVQELVRAQPHLVHDMGWPEIQEISRSQVESNSSQLNPPSSGGPGAARTPAAVVEDVEEEMERMVHLAAPQDAAGYRGHSDPDPELFGGPGAGDASQEASGFYGTDTEDRDRGEEGGEDRERRGGGEDEWEERGRRRGDGRGEGGEDERDASDVSHLTPDLDALIGYSPSLHPSSSMQPIISSPAELHDPGLQEHQASPGLEMSPQMSPLEREPWEAEGEDVQSSGYGVRRSSIATTTTATSTSATSAAAAAGGDAAGTSTPETATGTDFGLLGSFTKNETEDEETEREEEEEHAGLFTQNPTVPEIGLAPSREPLQPSVEEEQRGIKDRLNDRGDEVEEERWKKMEGEGTRVRHIVPPITDPLPNISFTNLASDWSDKTTPLEAMGSEVRGGGAMTIENTKERVVCIDWKDLVGRGYIVLNMTQNLNCEEFRVDQGVELLKIIELVFARKMNSSEGSWVIFLSKPTHQQHQLLMNVASGHGVIGTSDVLTMLGEISKSLNKVGIQNYSATSRCVSRPSQTRSDYGKLFVVLVIIGSVCMVIITSGFIYICWQRRLPATKTTFRAEELHFVENGCHDNPMLDVTNDNQPEMQEKKPSTNGLTGGGEREKDDSSRWQVFVNQAAAEEEEEEQDTHL